MDLLPRVRLGRTALRVPAALPRTLAAPSCTIGGNVVFSRSFRQPAALAWAAASASAPASASTASASASTAAASTAAASTAAASTASASASTAAASTASASASTATARQQLRLGPISTSSFRPRLPSSSSSPSPSSSSSSSSSSSILSRVSFRTPLAHHVRYVSTKPLPTHKGPVVRFFYRLFAWTGIFIVVSGALVTGFFVYDASTYREANPLSDIPVSEAALFPRRGGPKNLPIAEVLVDDEDSEVMREQRDKPKLVVLGTGWGSVAMLKELNPCDWHVTVVSPDNYFVFTPMLPSATVGTLELRSLVEPIRKIVNKLHGHFLRAQAIDIEFADRLVEVASVDSDGNKQHFYLPYDKLIIGVGSTTNPHGVKGLENCHFLKTIDDARLIKKKVLHNLELACLPTTSDEERRRLLSFVISGGGPTGVEFAAELYDMLNEDLLRSFPRILRNEVSVHVIQSRGHILNTYDEALSIYAEKRFEHDQVEVLTNSRVKEVQPDKIIFTQKTEDGKQVIKELPMGFCLWSTGVSQTDFCKRVAQKLGPEVQNNRHALETDSHLRVIGAPLGDVYAIGDCSTVQNNIADNLTTFLRGLAWEKGKDPRTLTLTFQDWRQVATKVKKRFPQAAGHLKRLDKLFQEYDKDDSGTLDFDELHELLKQIDSKLTSLPATAQRANQQGQYLGRKFNKIAAAIPGFRANEVDFGDLDEATYKAFEYHHMGSLAYVGNAAIFDFNGLNFSGGLMAVYLWRSIYFAQSVSLRTRILLAMDWSKRALFGRDLMSF